MNPVLVERRADNPGYTLRILGQPRIHRPKRHRLTPDLRGDLIGSCSKTTIILRPDTGQGYPKNMMLVFSSGATFRFHARKNAYFILYQDDL